MIQFETVLAENLFLSSLCIAIAVPCAILVMGLMIEVLQGFVTRALSLVLGEHGAILLFNYLLFPGVVVHECAHTLMAVITGAKVQEVALFKPEGTSLGHVRYQNRGGRMQHALQDVFIASAPMYVGALVLLLSDECLRGENLSDVVNYIIIYLDVSVFFHMTMSREDRSIFLRGVPLFTLMVFVLVLCAKFVLGNVVA